MAEYLHLTCPVCSKEFDENSDIVVCPICGTPHHRDCYKSIGRCANIDWHNENKTFDPELARAEMEGEKSRQSAEQDALNRESEPVEEITCRRCGHKSRTGAVFCENCGFPVSNGFGSNASGEQSPRGFSVNIGPMPFTPPDPNEDFDGVEGWKMAAVVRENQFSFMPKFMALKNKKSKVSFNFFACLLSPYYFFYRKMYLWGFLGLLVELLCSIPNALYMMTNQYLSKAFDVTVTSGLDLTQPQLKTLMTFYYIASLVSLAAQILSGMFANYLYYKKCNKTAKKLSEKAATKDEFLALADKKGGVNRVIIIVFISLMFIASWSANFILTSGMF